jgi:hypothetical protein
MSAPPDKFQSNTAIFKGAAHTSRLAQREHENVGATPTINPSINLTSNG